MNQALVNAISFLSTSTTALGSAQGSLGLGWLGILLFVGAGLSLIYAALGFFVLHAIKGQGREGVRARLREYYEAKAGKKYTDEEWKVQEYWMYDTCAHSMVGGVLIAIICIIAGVLCMVM